MDDLKKDHAQDKQVEQKRFALKEGMQFVIGGLLYQVKTVRGNGKIVIKYKGVIPTKKELEDMNSVKKESEGK